MNLNTRERLQLVLNGKMPPDRLPMIEYAPWWDMTIKRWENEGFPRGMTYPQIAQYFNLDETVIIYCNSDVPPIVVKDEDDYERVVKENNIYSDSIIEQLLDYIKSFIPRHDNGEIFISIFFKGFFWHPRTLFGIEPHLFAFYDYPDLMHRMNKDLCEFNTRTLKAILVIMKPDLVGYSEDMSYNHGPMVSKECFDEFILPYYKDLINISKAHGLKTILDSDGNITDMMPWCLETGIDGIYPFERQANVDIVKIREEYPEFIMIGGFDKMVMNKGEEAIRAEFERILPVMRSGYYIPSVDHQTPPGISFEDYKLYLKIFKEYCEKAVK